MDASEGERERERKTEGGVKRREPNGSVGGDSTLASRDGARRTDAARVSTGSGGFTELSRAIGKFNFVLVSFLFHKPFVRRRRRESSDDDAAAFHGPARHSHSIPVFPGFVIGASTSPSAWRGDDDPKTSSPSS